MLGVSYCQSGSSGGTSFSFFSLPAGAFPDEPPPKYELVTARIEQEATETQNEITDNPPPYNEPHNDEEARTDGDDTVEADNDDTLIVDAVDDPSSVNNLSVNNEATNANNQRRQTRRHSEGISAIQSGGTSSNTDADGSISTQSSYANGPNYIDCS